MRRRVPTLALTVFGFLLSSAALLATQVPVYIANLPDSQGSLGWLTFLIIAPALVTGIISGLAAALGAYVAQRMSTSMSVGAGLGGSVGSLVYLTFLSWFLQSGPGLWILVLGTVGVFASYTGFTALWVRRRVPGEAPSD